MFFLLKKIIYYVVLVSVVLYLAKFFGMIEFKESFIEMVKGLPGQVWDFFLGLLKNLWDMAWQLVKSLFQWIADYILVIWNQISDKIREIL